MCEDVLEIPRYKLAGPWANPTRSACRSALHHIGFALDACRSGMGGPRLGAHGHANTSSATGLHAALFLATWFVMMVAMMLPATAPMFLAFHKEQAPIH